MPEYTNCWQTYIESGFNLYPGGGTEPIKQSLAPTSDFITGWQILPQFLFKHFLTPKQWADFVIKHSTIKVLGYKTTLFNMIPMATQLNFQNTQAFTAFNNCIYGWVYQDNALEASYHNWWDASWKMNLAWKEGATYFTSEGKTPTRFKLPKYNWRPPQTEESNPNSQSNTCEADAGMVVGTKYPGQSVWPYKLEKNSEFLNWPSGIFWDPLNNAGDLLEIRPGKNAVTVSWTNPDPKEYNLDALRAMDGFACTGPYQGYNRPTYFRQNKGSDPRLLSSERQYSLSDRMWEVNDYTIPTWENQPIIAGGWQWIELKNQIIQQFDSRFADFWFTGTEKETQTGGLPQTFIKLVPLLDDQNTLINLVAQVSVRQTLILEGKPRHQPAIYGPTYGPFNWKTLYSANYSDVRFPLSTVVEQRKGIRRSWQNMRNTVLEGSLNATQINEWPQAHARHNPYVWTDQAGTGTWQTEDFGTTGKNTTSSNRFAGYNTAGNGSGIQNTYRMTPDITIQINNDTSERQFIPHNKGIRKKLKALFKAGSKEELQTDEELGMSE
ncbi:VP1/VP2 [Tasmanian devil-associated chapparvovirus 6]|uniref:VP1/VP2 n=1 Tax=Tasmanian devil-associated chapparvovirus 6 TaxID=2529487 RepID=A0A481W6J5_9VIRU|nr:VP1/VP2 [Tasmanian devil-associated chapparvovirus 6]QBJ04595.1 VP1/VP2 [Tasmanian devil-associated chapparvovirus 6]